MFLFFDYVYYRVCKAYGKTSDSNPRITALLMVALMQFFNLFTAFMLIELHGTKKVLLSKLLVVIVMLTLFVCNGFRYNRFNYDVLKEKWIDESKNKKTYRGVFILVYLLASTLACFILAAVSGSKKW